METDLKIRLQAYATTAEVHIPADTSPYADALASSIAAATAASAGIICSHSRVLRGDSPPPAAYFVGLRPGQHELDILTADKPSAKLADIPVSQGAGQDAGQSAAEPESHEEAPPRPRLPLRPGHDSLAKLALGASGVAAIKSDIKSQDA